MTQRQPQALLLEESWSFDFHRKETTSHIMNAKNIAYWVTTVLASLPMLGSGLGKLTGAEQIVQNMAQHGVPASVRLILGFWMVLAPLALLAPGFARIKEWAYAGIGFAMTGAAAVHVMDGDPVGQTIVPLVILGFAVASYLLRPASRRLDVPSEETGGRRVSVTGEPLTV